MLIDHSIQLEYRRINARFRPETIARHEDHIVDAVYVRCERRVAPTCYLGFETVRKCPNQCKGECGYKPRPTNCLAPDRSRCPDGCCEPSEGR